MICKKCNTKNKENQKFCINCGAWLVNICPNCKAENEIDAKYCGRCGQDIEKLKFQQEQRKVRSNKILKIAMFSMIAILILSLSSTLTYLYFENQKRLHRQKNYHIDIRNIHKELIKIDNELNSVLSENDYEVLKKHVNKTNARFISILTKFHSSIPPKEYKIHHLNLERAIKLHRDFYERIAKCLNSNSTENIQHAKKSAEESMKNYTLYSQSFQKTFASLLDMPKYFVENITTIEDVIYKENERIEYLERIKDYVEKIDLLIKRYDETRNALSSSLKKIDEYDISYSEMAIEALSESYDERIKILNELENIYPPDKFEYCHTLFTEAVSNTANLCSSIIEDIRYGNYYGFRSKFSRLVKRHTKRYKEFLTIYNNAKTEYISPQKKSN